MSFSKILTPRPVGHSLTRQNLKEQLERNIFPRQVVEEHITGVIENTSNESNWLFNHSVADLKAAYKKTSGFPVILAEAILIDALRNLCQNKIIGLTHARENFCGRYPSYSGSEWNDVIITEPFVDQEKVDSSNNLFENKTKKPVNHEISPDVITSTSNVSLNEPFTIYTTNKNSIIGLRQEVAAKLSEKEIMTITKVSFMIFMEKSSVELNTLPNLMRGQLSGPSDVHFELTITQNGNFSKSKIEELTEKLPVIQEASYKAELKGYVTNKSQN